MNTQPGPIAIADDLDRMYDQLDPVDDWRPAISAACDELRRQHAKIKRLTAERDALRDVPTELIACLIDARDDVAAELQRCREAAGYPSTDRRLEAQEALIARVDSAIAAAEDQPPAQPVKRLTDEQINALESLEGALEVLVDRCNMDAGMSSDCSVIAAEAALERVYRTRKSSESVEPTTQAATVNRLTDEQIASMWMAGYSDGSGRSMVNLFARAIERVVRKQYE